MRIPSIVGGGGGGWSSVPQPKFPEETCHPLLGETRNGRSGAPDLMSLSVPLSSTRSDLKGGGGGGGAGAVLLKNMAWKQGRLLVT